MDYFLWIVLVIIFVFYLILLTNFLSQFYSLIKTWVPYVNSFDSDISLIKDNIELDKTKRMVDLWCWNWKALRFFNNNFWLENLYWYDINLYSILLWKVINFITGKKFIKIYLKDFRDIDLWKFEYIYIYLFQDKYEEYILKNAKKWTIIINNSFKFSSINPIKVIKNCKWRDKIYVYHI